MRCAMATCSSASCFADSLLISGGAGDGFCCLRGACRVGTVLDPAADPAALLEPAAGVGSIAAFLFPSALGVGVGATGAACVAAVCVSDPAAPVAALLEPAAEVGAFLFPSAAGVGAGAAVGARAAGCWAAPFAAGGRAPRSTHACSGWLSTLSA